jgi:hypothetical protein
LQVEQFGHLAKGVRQEQLPRDGVGGFRQRLGELNATGGKVLADGVDQFAGDVGRALVSRPPAGREQEHRAAGTDHRQYGPDGAAVALGHPDVAQVDAAVHRKLQEIDDDGLVGKATVCP